MSKVASLNADLGVLRAPLLQLSDESGIQVPMRNASKMRWIMLALGVAIILGPYYSFDNPAGTENALKEYFGVPIEVDSNSTAAEQAAAAEFNTNYQLLYSLYSFPNTVLPLFGGYLVDVFGVRTMVLSCSILALLGQVIVVLGVNIKNWAVMGLGRAIFGIGTESLCVAQRILVSNWFVGKELALANGMILAFGRIGSVINDNVSALYGADKVVGAFCIGAIACLISVFATGAANVLDKRYDQPQHAVAKALPIKEKTKELVNGIRHFDARYWAQTLVCILGFPPVTTFNGVGVALLVARAVASNRKHDNQTEEATLGILYSVAAAVAPFGGFAVDKLKNRNAFMMGALILVGIAHALFIGTSAPAEVMLSMLGLGFAIFAATFWTNIAYVTPPHLHGVAYGLMGSIQNAGLAIAPLVAAALEPPACSSYWCVEAFFLALAGAGALILAILVAIPQKAHDVPEKESRTPSPSFVELTLQDDMAA